MSVNKHRPTAVLINTSDGTVYVPRYGEIQSITMQMEIPKPGQLADGSGEMPMRSFQMDHDHSGIITAEIEPETSVRQTNNVFLLEPAEKVTVLMEVYEQSARDRRMDLMETPILNTRTMRVGFVVLNWPAWCRWFGAHAFDDFYAMVRPVPQWSHRMNVGGKALLSGILEHVVPSLMLGTGNERMVIV